LTTKKQTFKPDYNALMGFVVAAFGLVYLIMTLTMKRSAIGNPMAPLYFPLGLGIMLVVFGVIQILRRDIKKSIESLKHLKEMNESDKKISGMIAYTCVSGVLYGLLFEHLGFVISTYLFMTAMLSLTNKKKHVQNVIVSLCFSVGIYLIFTRALGIPLPKMPFIGI
jgi:putative tricarboxylic transport membrane protein